MKAFNPATLNRALLAMQVEIALEGASLEALKKARQLAVEENKPGAVELVDREISKRAAEARALAKANTKANLEIEYRQEVIDAMVSTGIAPHVAAARTSTPAGLKAAAIEFDV